MGILNRKRIKDVNENDRRLYVKLQNILLEASRIDRLRGMPQGRIHGGSLHRIRHGEFNVFTKKTRGMDASQIAVAVVVDCSGSMDRDGKDAAALQSATLMGDALDKCGVKFGVYGFTSDGVAGNDYPINIMVKDFNSPWKGRREYMTRLGSYANNYDAASILEVCKKLLAVNATRRILIVISDGQPSPENSEYLKNLVPLMMQGVDVVGVGLAFTDIETFYPNNIKCEVAELAEKLAPVLQRLMTDKRTKRGSKDMGLFVPADHDPRLTAIKE